MLDPSGKSPHNKSNANTDRVWVNDQRMELSTAFQREVAEWKRDSSEQGVLPFDFAKVMEQFRQQVLLNGLYSVRDSSKIDVQQGQIQRVPAACLSWLEFTQTGAGKTSWYIPDLLALYSHNYGKRVPIRPPELFEQGAVRVVVVLTNRGQFRIERRYSESAFCEAIGSLKQRSKYAPLAQNLPHSFLLDSLCEITTDFLRVQYKAQGVTEQEREALGASGKLSLHGIQPAEKISPRKFKFNLKIPKLPGEIKIDDERHQIRAKAPTAQASIELNKTAQASFIISNTTRGRNTSTAA